MIQEVKNLLVDIEQSALNIDIHLEGRRIFEEFAENITKRSAIERELEIIGEQQIIFEIKWQHPTNGTKKNCKSSESCNTCLR